MTAGQCDFCAKPTDHVLNFMRCYRCKAAYYCSYVHQALHWPKHKAQCKAAAEVVQEWYMRKYGAQDMTPEKVRQRDTDFQSESDVVDLTEVFFGDEDVHIEPLEDSNTPGTTTGDKDCETHSDTEDLTAWVHGTEEDDHNNEVEDSDTRRTAMDETDCQSESDTEDLTAWIYGEEDVRKNEIQEAVPADDKENAPLDDSMETDAADNDEDDAEDWSHAVFRETNKQPTTSKGRAKKRPLGKTARKSTSTAAIRAIFTQNCCKNNCMKKFSYKEVASCRKDFWIDLNESQGREYILTAFRLGDCAVEGLYHPKFHLCGKDVCHKAWMKLNGISASRYYSYLKLYKLGQFNNPEHGRQGNIYPSPRSLHAEVWMEDFAAKKDSGKIVLPAFWTMNNVYQLYREDNKEEDVKPLGKTQFWKVWRASYSHVKIP